MGEISILLIFIILVALVFDYTNGAHDTANAIAPAVSTRVMSPKTAVAMAAILNFAGAFLGTHVAETIGKGIVAVHMIEECRIMILAGLVGAIFWNFVTWYMGLPSSSSHALIGGLSGAAVTMGGWGVLQYRNIFEKVILPLFLSPVAGFVAGYLLIVLLAWCTRRWRYRRADTTFKGLQIVSSCFMALSHGSNDAQKTMGVLALTLYLFHQIPQVHVPLWVKIACAMAIMLGTATGGWKIIKTMGSKIFKMQAIHGFSAQTATALVIFSASFLGAPISTTQVISSSILGAGSARRFSAVRWGVAGNMVVAWFLTLPAAGIVGAICMWIFMTLGWAR
jgi:inorganic phosphate transporter, PiT family